MSKLEFWGIVAGIFAMVLTVSSIGVAATWAVSNAISEVRSDISEVRREIGEVRGEIGEVRGEIGALNARVDGLEQRMGNLETEVRSINEFLRRDKQTTTTSSTVQ